MADFSIYCLIFHTGYKLAKTMEKPQATAASHQHGCHVAVPALPCPWEQMPHRLLRLLGAGFIFKFIFYYGDSFDFSTFQVHSPSLGRCLSLSELT